MKKVLLIGSVLLLSFGCAHKNNSGKEAQLNYQMALTDSIAKVTDEIDSCRDAAGTLSDQVDVLLRDFSAVNNSREVEEYMIFNGWQKRYPLQKTGLVARLNASEQIELVAALSNGVFDRIRIITPTETAETDVVENDQALNYRREGLTTVMFSGESAAKVASLIADNELNPITVVYLNNGKETGKWELPGDYAKMISMTSLLSTARGDQVKMERRSILLGEKLKLLRRHQEESNETKETK